MEGRGEPELRLSGYDFDLPSERIAQAPSAEREACRLLVLDRAHNHVQHRQFEEICSFLSRGDVLVVNDTRVVPARLRGHKETGGRVELLVLDPYKEPSRAREEGYTCLIKAAKPPKAQSVIYLEDGFRARVLTPLTEGKARVRFSEHSTLLDLLERIGEVPLPPYIQREGGEAPGALDDSTAYQTVYASKPGAVAAPTAGLHFSDRLLQQLESCGVEIIRVTLHVGYGTFSPIRVDDIRDHRMHAEYAEVSPNAAERLEEARREGRRIVAVGTTVVRILEWMMSRHGAVEPFSGDCNHYIYPGYRFGIVQAMITNFHLPKSSLLLLVSAFAGRERILSAYREAIREGYRFFSYGDAMLIV